MQIQNAKQLGIQPEERLIVHCARLLRLRLRSFVVSCGICADGAEPAKLKRNLFPLKAQSCEHRPVIN